MDWNELLAAMGRFGFSEREAKLYLLLLRRGRATARELTNDSKLDRVLAYRTLDGMRARGLVQLTAQRPRRYVPLAPKVLFERSLAERRRGYEEDVSLAKELAVRLPELTEEITSGAPRFQVITGTPAIYPMLREMVRRAKREVRVLVTPRALRESAEAGTYLDLPVFLRGGGSLRLVTEHDSRINALVRKFRLQKSRFPRAEVRTVVSQRARVTIVDDSEAMVFLVPEAASKDVEEIAVWADTADFVAAQKAHFEALWERAVPFRDMKSPPSRR